VGLTLPAARDLARYGIRANTIAPSLVDTPMLGSISEEFHADLASGVPFPRRLARSGEFAQLVTTIIEHDPTGPWPSDPGRDAKVKLPLCAHRVLLGGLWA
jgi:NAD(P)-dependent dehydrogenase (short-subunit alcohol dehydrogenase family)